MGKERTDDMDHSVASLDIGGNYLRHHIPSIATSLLKDTIYTSYSMTNCTAGLSIGHFNQGGTGQVFGVNRFINNMKQQNVSQQSHIVHDGIQ